MTEDEVRQIVGARLKDALGQQNSTLAGDREKAMDFYYGRPMGNEIDGRSQVVSKDLMDTVEWIMPSLMRVFCTMEAVQFDPVGPEDEDLAKQETGYVRHVLWKKNPGFMILYEWMKTFLLQKVGYVKYWWEEEEKVSFNSYTGLNDEQLTQVMQTHEQEGEVEVVGQEQDVHGMWSIKLRVTSEYGCTKIAGSPPENVIVSADCKGSIKTASFVGELRDDLTRSDLLKMGYSRKVVDGLTDYVWDQGRSETLARDSVNESTKFGSQQDESDWASVKVRLLEAHTYIDEDDDGIAELRHFLLGGNETLEDEEAEEIPWESATAIPVPFRHNGLSMYDIMEDLQRIHTALQRGLLDNVYFTNNPRSVYDKNTITLADLQINRPGGHVGNDGPVQGAIMPMPVTPMAGAILPVIDYFDTVRETRTGVGRMSVGVDADVLAQSTKGAYMDAKGAANQRIEAIARIFAETGYSSLFASLHGLLMRHQDWPEQFRMRDKWISTNPADWCERTDLTVSIGLGNASKDEVRSNLGLMAQAQEKAAAIPGLIQPTNVYALFRRMQAELGFENDSFITSPESPEYKQFMESQSKPPVDPYVQGKQIDADTKLKEAAIESRDKAADRDQERDLTITKLEVESGVDLAKAGIGAEVAVARGASAQGPRGAGAAQQPAAQ